MGISVASSYIQYPIFSFIKKQLGSKKGLTVIPHPPRGGSSPPDYPNYEGNYDQGNFDGDNFKDNFIEQPPLTGLSIEIDAKSSDN